MRNDLTVLQQEDIELRKSLADLQQENSELKRRLTDVQQENSELKKRLTELNDKVTSLNKMLNETKAFQVAFDLENLIVSSVFATRASDEKWTPRQLQSTKFSDILDYFKNNELNSEEVAILQKIMDTWKPLSYLHEKANFVAHMKEVLQGLRELKEARYSLGVVNSRLEGDVAVQTLVGMPQNVREWLTCFTEFEKKLSQPEEP